MFLFFCFLTRQIGDLLSHAPTLYRTVPAITLLISCKLLSLRSLLWGGRVAEDRQSHVLRGWIH